MMNRKITIEQTDGKRFRVKLGDTDISDFVTNIHIDIGVRHHPLVHLVCLPDRVELPTDLEAVVTATREDEGDEKKAAFLRRVKRRRAAWGESYP